MDLPPIMVKCCEAIEKYGIEAVGVYRIGGTVTKINKLKEKLDKGRVSRNPRLVGVDVAL